MENIYLLLIASLFIWFFWSLRKIEEMAVKHANHYCEQQQLQFIALARLGVRFRFNKRLGPHLLTNFALEFSSDGESSYTGELTMKGLKLDRVELPPYRLN